MQTDPNWANFLYKPNQDRLGLIDFGASREYTPEFINGWHALLSAALNGDKEGMKVESEKIGYLTGEEDQVCYIASPRLIDTSIDKISLSLSIS